LNDNITFLQYILIEILNKYIFKYVYRKG